MPKAKRKYGWTGWLAVHAKIFRRRLKLLLVPQPRTSQRGKPSYLRREQPIDRFNLAGHEFLVFATAVREATGTELKSVAKVLADTQLTAQAVVARAVLNITGFEEWGCHTKVITQAEYDEMIDEGIPTLFEFIGKDQVRWQS